MLKLGWGETTEYAEYTDGSFAERGGKDKNMGSVEPLILTNGTLIGGGQNAGQAGFQKIA
ncbi:hypothetical protein SBDP1_1300001 [Syntrophobacter sp. SbD1]|nr:hypothetical protein SBDP1_1300001 [Syntrophobacter sp. SbD1]